MIIARHERRVCRMSLVRTRTFITGLALALAVCAGPASVTAVASDAGPSAPAPSVSPPIATQLAACTETAPCAITTGTYVTATPGFLPGLRFSIEGDWSSPENWSRELLLGTESYPGAAVRFWMDYQPADGAGIALTEVPNAALALTDWFSHATDVEITPRQATWLGHDYAATTFVVTVPPTPGCATLSARRLRARTSWVKATSAASA